MENTKSEKTYDLTLIECLLANKRVLRVTLLFVLILLVLPFFPLANGAGPGRPAGETGQILAACAAVLVLASANVFLVAGLQSRAYAKKGVRLLFDEREIILKSINYEHHFPFHAMEIKREQATYFLFAENKRAHYILVPKRMLAENEKAMLARRCGAAINEAH